MLYKGSNLSLVLCLPMVLLCSKICKLAVTFMLNVCKLGIRVSFVLSQFKLAKLRVFGSMWECTDQTVFDCVFKHTDTKIFLYVKEKPVKLQKKAKKQTHS